MPWIEDLLNKKLNWEIIIKAGLIAACAFSLSIIYEIDFKKKTIFLEEESSNV